VSIVDPHEDFLADAKAKLIGLARFAERFGDRFVRIESIIELPDGTMRLLDIQDEKVRDAIEGFDESQVRALYESDAATTYV
jgi:type III restriction enzyme